MVRVTGLEPATSSFQVKHSTRLSYTLIVLDAPRGFEPRFSDSKSDVLPLDDGAKFGEGTESRTLACGFGDRRATITLYPHILEVDVRIELTTFVPGICNPAPCHPGHRPILFRF